MKKLNSETYAYVTKVSQYAQSKVIETHDGFILNTVYHHDKKALNATTQQIYNDNDTNAINKRVVLERYIDTSNDLSGQYNNIIVDKYNENMYYSCSREMLLKYTEKDGIIEVQEKSWNKFSNDNKYQYLGQTENYLFFSYGSNGTRYIYKMDKNTLVMTNAYTHYSYSNCYPNTHQPLVIKETNIAIYLFILGTNSTNTYAFKPIIAKIDKITETVVSLVTLENFTSTSSTYIAQQVYDCIEVSETHYYVIFKTPNNAITVDDFMSYVSVDISDETNVTATVGSISIKGSFTAPAAAYYTASAPVHIWTYTYNNKQYLYMIRKNSAVNAAYDYLYTFEITKNSNNVPTALKFISLKQGTTWKSDGINHILLSKDRSVVFLPSSNSKINLYKFDPTTLSYELCNTISKTYQRFGLDSLNRLWILASDYSVEVYGLTDYSSYSLEFEKAEYAYTGTDIETYVTFKCFDMTKSRVNGTFTLTIQGAAKFTENYDTTLTVTLNEDDTEDLKIPMVITGGGRIYVYPSLVS